MTGPQSHLILILLLLSVIFDSKYDTNAITRRELSLRLTQACQIQPSPTGFVNPAPPLFSLHFPLPAESHHYRQSSQALSGSLYGHGAELD